MSQQRLRLVLGGLGLLVGSLVTTGASAATSVSAWGLEEVVTPALAPNGQLAATSCVSATLCVSVGVAQDSSGRDVALAERWSGSRWVGETIPRPVDSIGTVLAGVSCTAANACTAVGNLQTGSGQHVALVERWNGSSWEIQRTPGTDRGTERFLSGVSCASSTDCSAVGYSQGTDGHESTLAEHWNGRAWEVQSTPNAVGAPDSVLSSVSCTNASACTAVGRSTVNFVPQALIERWTGTTWLLQTAAVPSGAAGSNLVAVSCTTDHACTGVGSFLAKSTKAGGALAEQWDGATWTVQPTPGSTLDFLYAVACTTSASCTAVGQTAGFSQPIADRWDGTSWIAQAPPSVPGALQTNLVAVACPTQDVCLATGSALYTSGTGTNLTVAEAWNGDQWAIQTSVDEPGATAFSLNGVSCASERACMTVGYYFDATGVRLTLAEEWDGAAWTIQPAVNPAGATDAALASVSCTSPRDCVAVGASTDSTGRISGLSEHWNGKAWSLQPSVDPSAAAGSILNSVSCSTRDACSAAGGSFDSAGTMTTLVERWDGTRWAVQPTPNPPGALYVFLDGVACPTSRSCTAVGLLVDASFRYSTFAEQWNGTAWQIQPTPNPEAIDGPNGTLEGGVSCPNPRACTAVGQWSPAPAPHPGVSLAEHWNGLNWQVQATPNPPAVDAVDGTHNAPLAGVACSTVDECTAVGNYASGDIHGDFLALAERWDGTAWTVQQASSPVGAYYTALHGVACPTPRTCVAVGDSTRYNEQTNTRGRSTGLVERWSRSGKN